MKLSQLLDRDLIVPDLEARIKTEAISEILHRVIVKHPNLDQDLLTQRIIEREKIEDTSYGRGFAFPHARTDAVDHMYIALGISKSGLEDRTSDDKRLHVVCLMLTPSKISKSYLQTLSAFANLARSPGHTEKLLSAQGVDDILKIIDDSGVEIRRELTVSDVMKRNVVTVNPDCSLKEVANALFEYRISGIIVVDEGNNVLGMIDNRQLVKAALPDYHSLISNLAMSYDSESFENILRTEEDVKVSQLMDTNVETLGENTSVVEAAALMLFKDLRRVPIVNGNKLIGVITISDIVSKIIRG